MTYKNANYGYGDAILETSNSGDWSNSWFSDFSVFSFKEQPFLVRGGTYGGKANTGLFSFSGIQGYAYRKFFIPCSAGGRIECFDLNFKYI